MSENRRAQLQAEIYAKGLGTYRGYIVEFATGEDLWLCGVSLRSGVLAQTETLPDILHFIDCREDGF
jgi:hypothetical protein